MDECSECGFYVEECRCNTPDFEPFHDWEDDGWDFWKKKDSLEERLKVI